MTRAARLAVALVAMVGAGLAHATPPAARPTTAPDRAAPSARCDVQWRFTPRVEGAARFIDAEVAWRAGDTSTSELVLNRDWGGADYARLLTDFRARSDHQWVLDRADPARKTVTHLPRERVAIRYRINARPPDPDRDAITRRDVYSAIVGNDWFHFVGYAAAVIPAQFGDDTRPHLCVTLDGGGPDGWLVSSLGAARAPSATFEVTGSPRGVKRAVYFGGAFDVRERGIRGSPLLIARRGPWRFDMDRYADLVARLIEAQRAFWADFDFPPLAIELLHTNAPRGSSGGTALDNAFLIYAPDDLAVPGEQFEFLLAHEHLHTWIPHRFGAMGENEALRYWFSEGFTDFYTHRLLVRAGVWTLDQYAAALNRKIETQLQSEVTTYDNARVAADFFVDPAIGMLPYQRGELLALRWHRMLAARDADGLDGVMRRLTLPHGVEADAKTPLPLATRRLLDALTDPVPEARADVDRYIEHGEAIPFEAQSLGPCFDMRFTEKPRFHLGFDRRSVKEGRLVGVEPDGPAYAAGLRDGQPISGFYLFEGDASKDAGVQLRDEADGNTREVLFRPTSGEPRAIPVYMPKDGAQSDPACRAWFGMPVA